MPVKYLLHPLKGTKLTFEEAPKVLEDDGVMPSYAVEAIIRDYQDDKGSFHVRPSDVSPKFTCRRQRVWQSTHDYGVNPLDAEGMVEGSALHAQLSSQEIMVPQFQDKVHEEVERMCGDMPYRLEVCGVPMRGRLDWLFPDRIEDLKTKTPFWAVKFGPKGSGEKPFAYIWEPKSDDDDIATWRLQLSIYRLLLEKSGRPAPSRGRVWRRYSGVKSDKGRWKRYDFTLLSESELEAEVGPWIRTLQEGLSKAEVSDPEAWRGVPADGKEMVGNRGNQWKCDKCELRRECEAVEGWSGF